MTQPNIYVNDGNQPSNPLPNPNWIDPLGKTGLGAFSGRILEDFLVELRGREGYKRYNEMRLNSPEVGGLLLAIENACRSVTFRFESDLGDEDERVEFLERSLANMSISLNDHISEALTMLPFGYAPFAIWYERVGGEILWRKFLMMGQNSIWRWYFNEEGGLEGLQQMAPPSYSTEDIPIERVLLYRTRVEKNNPEGRSILRQSWIPYYFQKNIQQVEGIGVERDLAGLPVIKLPQGADTNDANATNADSDVGRANQLVRNIRNDEQSGAVLPFGWELVLLSTGGSRQFDTDKIINRYSQRILMSALAQFLMLGASGGGSLALSKDQSDFFTMSVNTILGIIAETFTKYAVERLLKLNGYATDGIKLTHTPAGDIDLTALADFLSRTGSFITWRPEDEAWLRQVTSLPDVDVDELKAAKMEKQAQALQIAQARQPAPPPQTSAGMPMRADDPMMDKASEADAPEAEMDMNWITQARTQFYSAMTQFRKAIAGLNG